MKIGDLVVYDDGKLRKAGRGIHGEMALVTKVYKNILVPLCDIIWVGSGITHKGKIQKLFRKVE